MSKYDDDREELRLKVELLHALERLKNNADFKKVIFKGFCTNEVLNLNRMASRETTAEAKLSRSQQAQAGPVLEAYINRIELEGLQAVEDGPRLDAIARDFEDEETDQ